MLEEERKERGTGGKRIWKESKKPVHRHDC
jgi:hypothetical protein